MAMSIARRLRSGILPLGKVLQQEPIWQKSFVQRPLLYLSSAPFSEFSRGDATPTENVPKGATSDKFSRSVATPNENVPKGAKKNKVPLEVHGIFGEYATALYKLAANENVLETVESQVIEFHEASKKSEFYDRFVKDQSITKKTRNELMTKICAELKFTRVLDTFLIMLADDQRLRYLDEIINRFQKITRAYRGEVEAVVTSAAELSPDELKNVMVSLEELNPGKKISLKKKVDPNILGGLVLDFDEFTVDISVKSRMEEMQKCLKKSPAYLQSPHLQELFGKKYFLG